MSTQHYAEMSAITLEAGIQLEKQADVASNCCQLQHDSSQHSTAPQVQQFLAQTLTATGLPTNGRARPCVASSAE